MIIWWTRGVSWASGCCQHYRAWPPILCLTSACFCSSLDHSSENLPFTLLLLLQVRRKICCTDEWRARHCRPRDGDSVGCVQDLAGHLPEARWCWQHILPNHFYNITNIACWYRQKIHKLATRRNQVPEENKFIVTFKDNIQPRRYPIKLTMRNNGANEMYHPIDYLKIASV
jgi:hypothetical protein